MFLALLFALTVLPAPAQQPTASVRADVLIGAGHEGRPQSCKRFPKRACNLGTAGERTYTPMVADEATRLLRAAGVNVIRVPADFAGTYEVSAAVFIHFDGNSEPCQSGASIGFHRPQDRNAAQAWRTLYSRYWSYRFQPDNFTANLSNYYGFRQVNAADSALVLELGELTCAQQREWLEPRIQWEGRLIAHFLSVRIHKGNVPLP